MRRKVELIQQIRAMESVPVIRTKFVDLTETANRGLLSEMSTAEVNEFQTTKTDMQCECVYACTNSFGRGCH